MAHLLHLAYLLCTVRLQHMAYLLHKVDLNTVTLRHSAPPTLTTPLLQHTAFLSHKPRCLRLTLLSLTLQLLKATPPFLLTELLHTLLSMPFPLTSHPPELRAPPPLLQLFHPHPPKRFLALM
ncbi:hypothetical protein C0991_012608, partial [Blastosporella zonata]